MAQRTRETFCQERLQPEDRRRIAEELFAVTSVDDRRGELMALCPFHAEKTPSFSYNWLKDVFSCFGCTAKGDLIDLWCHVSGKERMAGGFRDFCQEYGIERENAAGLTRPKKPRTGDSAKPKKSPSAAENPPDAEEPEKKEVPAIPEEVWEAFPPIPDEIIEQLIERRKWSRAGIEKAGLRFYVHDKAGAKLRRMPLGEWRVAIPVRDEAGVLRNVRFYAPFGTQDGHFKIVSWAKGYGEGRLLGVNLLRPEPIWYCEGEPDWICAISNGLNAITKTIGAKVHKKEWNKVFRGRDVIFIYDADKTGLAGAEKGAVMLARDAESVRVLMWPRFMYIDNPAPKHDGRSDFTPFVMTAGEEYPQDHGDDLTDFLVRHGRSIRELRDLLPSAKTFTRPKHEDAEIGGAARFFGGSRGTTFFPVLLAKAYLTDNPLTTDPAALIPFRWNGQYHERYEVQYIRTACTRMLEDCATTRYVNDAVNIALNLSTLEPGRKFNDRPHMRCIKNGMLNLDDGEVYPHDPDYYATYQLGVSYPPKMKDPECPMCKGAPGNVECPHCWGRGDLYSCLRWIQFLKETVQVRETIMQLQEFFGLCLTQETRFAKCLLCIGPGSDGKSILLDMLQALVGDENCSAVSMADLEKEFYRASLYNKALNVSAEFDSGAFHSDWFKKLVTGDMVSASFKHRDFFEFRFWGKMAFAANRYPKALDNTDGFFRRLLVVKFKRQFLGKDKDIYLKDRLLEELDGIFAWALEGLARLWGQQEFTESTDSAEALLEYKRTNNPVLCFAEDCLVYRQDLTEVRLGRSAAYEAYKKYCAASGFNAGSIIHFGRELKTVFPSLAVGRLKGGPDRDKCFLGLCLVDSDEGRAILQREREARLAAEGVHVPGPSPDPSPAGAPHDEGGQ